MEQKVTKEEADRLMAIPGNVRGEVLLTNGEYIRQLGGEEKLKQTEERMKELGHPLLFKNIKQMEHYPEALSVLLTLLARELLNLDEEGVFKMGKAAAKLSFFMKVLTKYFVSIKRSFEESPRYWQKHFDFGRIEIVDFSEEKKYGTFRVIGYKFHPIMCIYHRGYFMQIAQLILGRRSVRIEETKCQFKGDPYHEYVVHWV